MNSKLFWILIAVVAVVIRLLPHAPNLAPMGALAIMAGLHLPRKWALVVPLIISLAADLFLGLVPILSWVYLSYVMMIWSSLFSQRLFSRHHYTTLVSLSLAGSFCFYLVTNFGVWIAGSMYDKSLAGLMQSYTMAIPFFRNTVIGDLLFVLVLSSLYSLVVNPHKNNKISPTVAPSTPINFLGVRSSLKR